MCFFAVNYIGFLISCTIAFPLKLDEGNHTAILNAIKEIQIVINSGILLHYILSIGFWACMEHTNVPLSHLSVPTCFPFNYQQWISHNPLQREEFLGLGLFAASEANRRGDKAELNEVIRQ